MLFLLESARMSALKLVDICKEVDASVLVKNRGDDRDASTSDAESIDGRSDANAP